MDLGNTDIEIRERDLSQRVDIAMRYMFRRPLGLLAYTAIGVLPAMLLNAALVIGLDWNGEWANSDYWYVTWVMIWYLTLVQAPLATAPLLIYLGQTLFRQRMDVGILLQELSRRSYRQLLLHGVYRLQLLWLIWVVWAYSTHNTQVFSWAVVVSLLFSAPVWAFRPYADAIVYLERLPLRTSDKRQNNVGRRARNLHGFDSSGILNESLLLLGFSAVLVYGAFAALLWLYYWSTFHTATQQWFGWSLFALALWLPMVFAAMLRFLGYLDIRIRSEGWELELRMKREAAVLLAQQTGPGLVPVDAAGAVAVAGPTAQEAAV